MSRNTVHLYFDGSRWRVRSQDARVPPRGPYDTYFAANVAAHDLAQELGADERHHDRGEIVHDSCDPPAAVERERESVFARLVAKLKHAVRADAPTCVFKPAGHDGRAALAASKQHWMQTLEEIEQLMHEQPPADRQRVPDEPGEPADANAPVPADVARELDRALAGMSGAGDLMIQFWQTAERDGLEEAMDRLEIALADTHRDLSRVREMVDRRSGKT